MRAPGQLPNMTFNKKKHILILSCFLSLKKMFNCKLIITKKSISYEFLWEYLEIERPLKLEESNPTLDKKVFH